MALSDTNAKRVGCQILPKLAWLIRLQSMPKSGPPADIFFESGVGLSERMGILLGKQGMMRL